MWLSPGKRKVVVRVFRCYQSFLMPSSHYARNDHINRLSIKTNHISSRCVLPCFVTRQMFQNTVGHPTTVFRKISVRRSKYCLEFSITWGWLVISRWPFHWFMYNFPSLPYKFPKIFWSLIFTFYFPSYVIFRRKKATQNFRIQKCDGKRNQKMSHFRNTSNFI